MLDYCGIVHRNNKGWILDRIAKEVATQFTSAEVVHYPCALPEASTYLVTHYSMLPEVLMQVPPHKAQVFCFFTHPKPNFASYTDAFNVCAGVIAESPEGADALEKIGVNPSLIRWVPEGGDSTAFTPHDRTGAGSVLICGAFYDRKSPDKLLQVILQSQRSFILLGKGWDERFSDLPNLTVLSDIPYWDYPSVYGRCDVYLSASTLEGGGPNSLIEAMHANLLPVVSDTGNARQYILPGYNGLIFPTDASAEAIVREIELAYAMNPKNVPPYSDVYETVAPYTWPAFAHQVHEVMSGDKPLAMEDILAQEARDVQKP